MIRYIKDVDTGQIRVAPAQEQRLRALAAQRGKVIGPIRTTTDLAKALLAALFPSSEQVLADALARARKSSEQASRKKGLREHLAGSRGSSGQSTRTSEFRK